MQQQVRLAPDGPAPGEVVPNKPPAGRCHSQVTSRPRSDGESAGRGYRAGDVSHMKANGEFLERDRVRRHTTAHVQQDIDQQTRRHIRLYACQSRAELDRRIAELDREWDLEQVLETNASILALTGALLGTTVNKRFFALTGVVLGFLTEHAISGWCPPVPIFRRLGVRTRTEINQEKYALKALRGDFSGVADTEHPRAAEHALQAVIA